MHAVLFLSKGFYRFVEGLIPVSVGWFTEFSWYESKALKKLIQKVLKFKVLKYLIDSTKICLVSLSIFLWNCNFISPLANELFEVDQIFKKKREENEKEEFYFINEASNIKILI